MAILIIEDEFLVAAEIKFHLERGGFVELAHAATEDDGLAAIARHPWDGAVVDANLNGQGIYRIVAALQEKSIPFIIVTGYGRNGLPQAVADVPVLDKPFHPQTLVNTVAQVCTQPSGGKPPEVSKHADP